MKKAIFLFLSMALLTGCKTSYTNIAGYVQKHCVATKESDGAGNITVTYDCANLYNTEKVKDKCTNLTLCFDAAQARVYGQAVCSDTLIDIQKLIKLAINRK